MEWLVCAIYLLLLQSNILVRFAWVRYFLAFLLELAPSVFSTIFLCCVASCVHVEFMDFVDEVNYDHLSEWSLQNLDQLRFQS